MSSLDNTAPLSTTEKETRACLNALARLLDEEGISKDDVLGGGGFRLSVGAYLSLIERLSQKFDVAVSILLQVTPPVTIGQLSEVIERELAASERT